MKEIPVPHDLTSIVGPRRQFAGGLKTLDSSLKHLLILTVVVKLSFLGLMALSYFMFSFVEETYFVNFYYPPDEPVSWVSVFKTWDAHHYLKLAEEWYSPDSGSNAYFPLLPFLIRICKFLFFQNSLVTGLVLSHLFAILAVLFFYLFVKSCKDEKTAFWSCLFLLSFPTSFYNGLIYTESLFLFLTLALFYFSYLGRRFYFTWLIVFLLPLCRPQGLFILFPLLGLFLRKDGFSVRRKCLLIVGFMLGFSAYLVLMKLSTGTCFPQTKAQEFFVANYSMSNIFHLKEWFVRNFIDVELHIHGLTDSWTDRLLFGFYLGVLIFNLRHCDLPLILYSLSMGLLPAIGDHFMSYSRYLMLVFPMYISLAILFRERHYLITVPMFVLQVMFLMMHALNHWVA